MYIERELLMNIEKFCNLNKELVKNVAKGLLQKNGLSFDDLYQEGMVAIVELFNSNKLRKVPLKKWKGYIHTTVKRSMLKLIAQMSGVVSVNSSKFFDKDFKKFEYENIDNHIDKQCNNDELVIQLEDHLKIDEALINVLSNLTVVEGFIWDNIIMKNEPMKTKEVAKKLGYKSSSSVTYIKNKIINKIRKQLHHDV